MYGDPNSLAVLEGMAPNSLEAMKYLVMAMADLQRVAGEKNWRGVDKGLVGYEKVVGTLFPLAVAMWKDGITNKESDYGEMVDTIKMLLVTFSEAYPNWRDAYAFGDYYFGENREVVIKMLDTLFKIEAKKVLGGA